MPFQANPLYNDNPNAKAAETAAAIAKLGSSLFGGGDPADQLKAMSLGASARKDRAAAALDEDKYTANTTGIRDLINDPTLYNTDGSIKPERLGDVFSMSHRMGDEDVGGHLLNPLLAMTAKGGGAGDLMRRGLVSAGKMPDVNTALSMGESNQISARDAGEEYARDIAVQKLRNQGDIDVQNLKNEADAATQKQIADALGSQLFGAGATGAQPAPGQMGPPAPGAAAPEPDLHKAADAYMSIGMQTGNQKLINTGSLLEQRANREDQMYQGQVDKYNSLTKDWSGIGGAVKIAHDTLAKYNGQNDIPGFGKEGWQYDWVVGPEGREARQATLSVLNQIAKARSGATVTDQEADRLAGELGYQFAGGQLKKVYDMKSPDQLRRGLHNIEVQLNAMTRNAGSSMSPRAGDIYKQQGGMMPPDYFQQYVDTPLQGVPTPQTDADFAKIPPGGQYIDPDSGELRTKR